MKSWTIPILILISAFPALGQTVIFNDGFDPWINYGVVNWVNGPWWDLQNPKQEGHHLEGDQCYVHSMPNAMRGWENYRVAYDMMHPIGLPYLENVYLRGWIYEDKDVPTVKPYIFPEYTPNGYLTLANTNAVTVPVSPGEDWYRIGVRGRYAISSTYQRWADDFFIDTKIDGAKCLTTWPRRRGWRKVAVEIYPYTGNPGDVKFYLDDTLVYSGRRDPDSYVDRIIMGPNVWTYENYWYDDIQLGWIQQPTGCTTLSQARQQADGDWISLTGKIVSARFTKRPFGGWAAVQEPDRSSGLWVSTSKELTPGDEVTIRGRMASSPAGLRYLDAAEILVTNSGAVGPVPLGANGRSLDEDPDLTGLCATLWGRASGRGQEPSGDARRYLTLTTSSLSETVRVYYDSIADESDNPVPNPSTDDFILVTGPVGREKIGETVMKTLWIRGPGDLVIPQ